MLIIAIPKSASTSLGKTFTRLHNLGYDFAVTFYKEKGEGNIVEMRHGSMGDLKNEDVKKFKDPNKVYKEHIFPTKKNVELLKDQKKVILLREPKEILHSWWRSEQSRTHPKHPILKDCKTEEDYVKKAEELGALKIFKDFKEGWEKTAGKNDLVIYYKDLKNNPKETVNKVERHFGLPESENVKLLKMRYNRTGTLRKIGRKIYAKIPKYRILEKIKRKLFPNSTL